MTTSTRLRKGIIINTNDNIMNGLITPDYLNFIEAKRLSRPSEKDFKRKAKIVNV